ncbi:MAG TPA: DUF2225 domain-containing protein [Thermoplasmata archaeon]|nr:DUF2225 domain-containing protein [Thermoplasmata archaeon]
MEDFFEKKVICPVCKTKFNVLVVRHGSYQVKKRDSDFCIHYEGVNPLHYSVWACPNCNYAVLSNEFEKINVKYAKKLVEICQKNISNPNKVSFSGVRTTEMAVESYKQVIECDKLRGVGSGELAGLYLRIAWLYRGQGRKDKEKEYMKEALSLYEDAFENARQLPSKLGTVGVAYLIGELYRRLGNSKEAVKWFSLAVSHPEAKVRRDLEKMARTQWQMAREGYVEESEREKKSISFVDELFGENEISAVSALLHKYEDSSDKITEFEKSLKKYLGCDHVFVLSSGGTALLAALLALDIKIGDEVITSSFDFWSSASTIFSLGARPVLVDINPETLCIDALKIKEKVGPKTKAILVNDYAGCPCELDLIKKVAKEVDLPVIENAQFALGSKLKEKKIGNISDITCFDLSPLSPINTGRGGLVTTNNEVLARKVGLIKNCGFSEAKERWVGDALGCGFDLNMAPAHAALGLIQLEGLDKKIEEKNDRAKLFNEALSKLDGFASHTILPDVQSSWAFYPLKLKGELESKGNNWVTKVLNENELEARIPPKPPFLQPYYQKLGFGVDSYPFAEEVLKKLVLLPFHNRVSQQNIERIIFLLQETVKNLK